MHTLISVFPGFDEMEEDMLEMATLASASEEAGIGSAKWPPLAKRRNFPNSFLMANLSCFPPKHFRKHLLVFKAVLSSLHNVILKENRIISGSPSKGRQAVELLLVSLAKDFKLQNNCQSQLNRKWLRKGPCKMTSANMGTETATLPL